MNARWLPPILVCAALVAGAPACSDADDDDATTGAGGSAGTTGGSTTGGRAGGGAPNDNAGSGGTPNGDAGTPSGDAGAESNAGGGSAPDHVPYANVVAVVASGEDGAYNFSVSVESSDTGCDEYANWWEVLTEDGELSYRRIIDHSHTDANGASDPDAPGNTFTRGGGPVPVSVETTVVVRAHMSVGGYNGVALRGSVASGFTQAPDIDAHFAEGVETAEPQPGICTF